MTDDCKATDIYRSAQQLRNLFSVSLSVTGALAANLQLTRRDVVNNSIRVGANERFDRLMDPATTEADRKILNVSFATLSRINPDVRKAMSIGRVKLLVVDSQTRRLVANHENLKNYFGLWRAVPGTSNQYHVGATVRAFPNDQYSRYESFAARSNNRQRYDQSNPGPCQIQFGGLNTGIFRRIWSTGVNETATSSMIAFNNPIAFLGSDRTGIDTPYAYFSALSSSCMEVEGGYAINVGLNLASTYMKVPSSFGSTSAGNGFIYANFPCSTSYSDCVNHGTARPPGSYASGLQVNQTGVCGSPCQYQMQFFVTSYGANTSDAIVIEYAGPFSTDPNESFNGFSAACSGCAVTRDTAIAQANGADGGENEYFGPLSWSSTQLRNSSGNVSYWSTDNTGNCQNWDGTSDDTFESQSSDMSTEIIGVNFVDFANESDFISGTYTYSSSGGVQPYARGARARPPRFRRKRRVPLRRQPKSRLADRLRRAVRHHRRQIGKLQPALKVSTPKAEIWFAVSLRLIVLIDVERFRSSAVIAAAALAFGVVSSTVPQSADASATRGNLLHSWCAKMSPLSSTLITADYREGAIHEAATSLCSGNVEAARMQYEKLVAFWRNHQNEGRQWANVSRDYFITLLVARADSEAEKFDRSLGSSSDLPAGNLIFMRDGFAPAALSYARAAAQFDHLTQDPDKAILNAVAADKAQDYHRVLSSLSQIWDAYGYVGQASLHELIIAQFFVSRRNWNSACDHFAQSLASSDPEPGWVSLSRYNLSSMMFLLRYREHCRTSVF